MKSQRIVICSTSRIQCVIENDIRYDLNPALLLKLREYLNTNSRKGITDIVSKWVAEQPQSVQKEIQVYPYYHMVA